MVYFQQSLFGKMSWERFHQITGWILEPSYPLSQTPMFQCLLLEDGQEPEWCEGERLTSLGGSWTPSIGQAPGWHDGSVSFLWQTLEDGAPTKYFLSPAQCSHFLHLAEIAGCPPPAEIEALLLKQGGAYQSPDPFNASVCGRPPRSGRKQLSETALDCQPKNNFTIRVRIEKLSTRVLEHRSHMVGQFYNFRIWHFQPADRY